MSLKKAEVFLKSTTSGMKSLPDAEPNSASVVSIKGVSEPAPLRSLTGAAPSPTTKTASLTKEEPSSALLPLSDNPVVAFFQRLDSKIMQVVFGRPEKYAVKLGKKLDDEKSDQIEQSDKVRKNSKPSTAIDVLSSAKKTEQAISAILTQEKSLNDFAILAKSAEVLTGS